jgi:uncharacterized protein (TIGR04255 family)
MMSSLPPPLGGPAPAEIALSRSPLVRVVAQARFSNVLKIDSKDAMAAFQDEVGSAYPVLEQGAAPQFQVEFGPGGAPNVRPVTSPLWRFSDAERGWLLSLASEAVTLETQHYEGRTDFLRRWREALDLVERVFAPRLALRLGIRYVNRIHEEALVELPRWVRDTLLGVVQPELRDYVKQALSEATLMTEEGILVLRWGIVPANATFDPGLFLPVPAPSWVLDIDASSASQRPFSGEALETAFCALSNRAYSVFRYAVTPAALEHFGAQL